MLTHFTDIFNVGIWQSLSSDIHPSMPDHLVQKLPDYVLSSRADSTRKKYTYGFNSWCKWSKLHCISSLPASTVHIALYLVHISETFNSTSKIDEAVYAISWAHKLAGFPNPCNSDLVISVREGSYRKIGHKINKKEPITANILSKIVHLYGQDCNNLKDVRIACMCLLSYAGFLRFSELANLKRSNVTFLPTHVKLFLEQSKTDVYREGRDVVISKTGNNTCPVAMLEHYMKLAQIAENSDEFVFRSLSYCSKSGTYKLRKNSPLSYTRAREVLLNALETIGLDKKQFGLHSLRSGGATAAAAAGVEDRLFKKHGRWKSENAKDGYIKESIDNRLSVSKKLGI